MPSDKRARKRSKQERQQAHQAALQHRRRQRGRLVSAVAIIAALGIAFIGVFSYMRKADRSLSVRETGRRGLPATTTTSPDAPCPNPDGSSARRDAFRRPPRFCIDTAKNYAARFQTDAGTFTVELATKDAPETVNNFVFLSRYHFYDGIPFNRVKPGFIVQGGNPPAEAVTGPGYSFADENVPKARYQVGQILMARDKPNANGSQFIIIMGPEGENLPLVFPLFGKITDGMDVVRKIEADGGPDFTPVVIHTIRQITIIES